MSTSGGQLLIECPVCKRRNGQRALAKAKTKTKAKVETCLRCGYALGKDAGKVYWIEWRPEKGGEKKRERIGPNKAAAEHRLREVLSARAEGRVIQKSPDAGVRFKTLAEWYLALPKVAAKKSYIRDKQLIANLLPHFGEMLLKDIIQEAVEDYQQKRLSEPSRRSPGKLTAPATVNREVACLKAILNKAVDNGKAEHNRIRGKKVKMLEENNERDRVLTPEEYARLLAYCPPQIKPIVKLAYHSGMRQGEILNLTWGRVDLKTEFVRLRPEDTKTKKGRNVPLRPEMVEIFKGLRATLGGVPLPGVRVFPYKGKAFGSTFQRAFETARKKAGIEDFTFHDLRHTFITNAYRAGVPIPTIMEITGHKTFSMFQRYNAISQADLKAAVGRI